jgi:hypothetical protein
LASNHRKVCGHKDHPDTCSQVLWSGGRPTSSPKPFVHCHTFQGKHRDPDDTSPLQPRLWFLLALPGSSWLHLASPGLLRLLIELGRSSQYAQLLEFQSYSAFLRENTLFFSVCFLPGAPRGKPGLAFSWVAPALPRCPRPQTKNIKIFFSVGFSPAEAAPQIEPVPG